MDFSTLEKRHAACQAEIAVNRENAPNIYRGVVPITRHAGHMQLGGDGEIVEWAVHLRRFDENSTLDHLAARGPLGPKVTLNLAEAIATSHRRAPRRDGEVATNAFHRLLKETARELMQVGGLFPADQAAMYTMLIEKTFTKAESFLRRRGALGQVRRCHGDLHLGNIVLIDGDPVLFDSIEFDDAIATSDILYDVAFLIMDLCHRDLHQDANHLLNSYLLTCEDRLFMSLRAAVRAKVLAVQALGDSSKASEPRVALAYFETAMALLHPAPPQLIAIGGRSGTGKSTLAAAIAPSMGRQPGAIHVRSDVERKKYFGVRICRR
jgi:aminoglycoside phosphotransferase family enzyme